MVNITKNRQKKEQLVQMVERTFGNQIQLEAYNELEEGFCNIAYQLKLSDGREYILKISPERSVRMMSCEVNLMKTEVEAMRLATANQIPGVAKVYGYDNSRELCSGEYFIMEKLPGQSYFSISGEMSDVQREKLELSIGKYLRKIHDIEGTKFGHFNEKSLQYDNWHDAFTSMMQRIIQDGIDANIYIEVSYEDILKKLESHKHCFDEVSVPHLAHWDTWDGNIFVKNGELTGLIDWERTLWAEGLIEDRFRYHNKSASFRAGYGLEELTQNQFIRSRWYDVYLYLIMMFEGYYRHYDNDNQYNWVHGLFLEIWPQLDVK